MTDTELSGNWLTNSLTTVVFPEPEPPAIPMTNIFFSFKLFSYECGVWSGTTPNYSLLTTHYKLISPQR